MYSGRARASCATGNSLDALATQTCAFHRCLLLAFPAPPHGPQSSRAATSRPMKLAPSTTTRRASAIDRSAVADLSLIASTAAAHGSSETSFRYFCSDHPRAVRVCPLPYEPSVSTNLATLSPLAASRKATKSLLPLVSQTCLISTPTFLARSRAVFTRFFAASLRSQSKQFCNFCTGNIVD